MDKALNETLSKAELTKKYNELVKISLETKQVLNAEIKEVKRTITDKETLNVSIKALKANTVNK